ncbi:hypothetical protein DKG34_40220 [Streptomyces sp. NWU49]|nr:hypothetical protein DKG34_40220 [Streptomyces sp. NWU49]
MNKASRRTLVREREKYFRLMNQGLSSLEACRRVGINTRTGKRWRNDRLHQPPVPAGPPHRQPRPATARRRPLRQRQRLQADPPQRPQVGRRRTRHRRLPLRHHRPLQRSRRSDRTPAATAAWSTNPNQAPPAGTGCGRVGAAARCLALFQRGERLVALY